MKNLDSVLLALILSLVPFGDARAESPGTVSARAGDLYFGQDPPGDTPVVFAPRVISLDERFEQFLLYSPDRREVVYSVTNSAWTEFTLDNMRIEHGTWSKPATAPFLGSSADALTAAFSADGKRVFITTTRPAYPPCNIWMSERRGKGWSEPILVGPPVSSDGNEFEVAISENGTLYFSSNRKGGHGDLDIYRARPVDGRYPEVENLGPTINSEAGDDLPWIAPDESYLIFGSDREGGFGERDLYVSFQARGSWTLPLNLGPEINTAGFDIYPAVSPDGKYLFFTRRTEWMAKEDSDIYWVSARVIARLRQRAKSADSAK